MRIGIIGAGGISAHHARAFKAVGAEIAAVADISRDAFLAKRDLFGNAKYFSSYQELLADPSIDAVDICVSTRWHAEIIRGSAAAGKHIFSEKTMTESEPASRELMKQLVDYRKNFQIGYMKRFFPATIKAMELLPELGEIFSAYVTSYQGFERTNDIYDSDGWKPNGDKSSPVRSYACGGMLNMAGSHMLDLMNMLLGNVSSVYSLSWKPPAYDAETNSHALFRMSGGAIVHFEAALSPYSRDGRWRDGWDECFEINGKRGKMRLLFTTWDRSEHNAPLLEFYSEAEKKHSEFTFPRIDAFAAEMEHFIRKCRDGEKSVPGVLEAYYVDRIIGACYESAECGKELRL